MARKTPRPRVSIAVYERAEAGLAFARHLASDSHTPRVGWYLARAFEFGIQHLDLALEEFLDDVDLKVGKRRFSDYFRNLVTKGEPAAHRIDRSPDRKCGRCEQRCGGEAPDPCLGYLPGVVDACCGHGEKPAVIVFRNGTTIKARLDAVTYAKGARDDEHQTV